MDKRQVIFDKPHKTCKSQLIAVKKFKENLKKKDPEEYRRRHNLYMRTYRKKLKERSIG